MAPSPLGTQREIVAPPYTDFTNVAPPHSSLKLYVGSQPPFDRELAFDILVLCARELQPERLAFRGQVLRCPMPDDVLTKSEITTALVTSSQVAVALADKKRVLVTCHAGLNRSALVAGLALARVTRMTAPEIVLHLRSRRDPNCLFNPHFQAYLKRFVEGNARARQRG